ncbi:MAG TPA: endonuclease III [Bacteroidota bacterium]|nr:endonuclease III [Bacteroidota bacterium]
MATSRKVDWPEALKPLFKQYKGKKHPLDYKNRYQLTVMVILSAQDSDRHINEIAPALFKAFPSMKELAKVKAGDLQKFIGSVRNFGNKTKWLMDLAKAIGTDDNIPQTLDELTALSGIGRKSANVIIRESGGKAEGIIVDLHVIRVAPRLGIAEGEDPKKIEKQLMEVLPQKDWNDAGMSFSFLGREICRPTDPKCPLCVVNKVCAYYAKNGSKKS